MVGEIVLAGPTCEVPGEVPGAVKWALQKESKTKAKPRAS